MQCRNQTRSARFRHYPALVLGLGMVYAPDGPLTALLNTMSQTFFVSSSIPAEGTLTAEDGKSASAWASGDSSDRPEQVLQTAEKDHTAQHNQPGEKVLSADQQKVERDQARKSDGERQRQEDFAPPGEGTLTTHHVSPNGRASFSVP